MRYRRITYRYQEIVGKQPSLSDTWPGMPAFPVGGAGWRPPADVFETRERYCVRLEIPGVDEAKLEILLYADTLVIKGARPSDAPADARFHQVEIHHGPFVFDMPLPDDVDAERVEARYRSGFLEVVLARGGTA